MSHSPNVEHGTRQHRTAAQPRAGRQGDTLLFVHFERPDLNARGTLSRRLRPRRGARTRTNCSCAEPELTPYIYRVSRGGAPHFVGLRPVRSEG